MTYTYVCLWQAIGEIFECYFRLHPGEGTPLSSSNHVQRKFVTPILYAIDNFKNYDIFFYIHISIDDIFFIFF